MAEFLTSLQKIPCQRRFFPVSECFGEKSRNSVNFFYSVTGCPNVEASTLVRGYISVELFFS
jgi:hypothetical protein